MGYGEMTDKPYRKVWHTAETFTYMPPDEVNSILVGEIESLRQQLVECQAMYSDLEAVYKHSVDNENNLTAQLAECNGAANTTSELYGVALQQLAECQAREKVLRDALKESYDEDGLCVDPDDFVKQDDSTALDTMKRQWQREALLEAAAWFSSEGITTANFYATRQLERMAKELF